MSSNNYNINYNNTFASLQNEFAAEEINTEREEGALNADDCRATILNNLQLNSKCFQRGNWTVGEQLKKCLRDTSPTTSVFTMRLGGRKLLRMKVSGIVTNEAKVRFLNRMMDVVASKDARIEKAIADYCEKRVIEKQARKERKRVEARKVRQELKVRALQQEMEANASYSSRGVRHSY